MRITINAERVELSTQSDCEPNRWNSSSGRANGVKEEIKSLDVYLDSLHAKVYEVQWDLIDKNEAVTVENMKRNLRGVVERPNMLLELFRSHNDQMGNLILS